MSKIVSYEIRYVIGRIEIDKIIDSHGIMPLYRHQDYNTQQDWWARKETMIINVSDYAKIAEVLSESECDVGSIVVYTPEERLRSRIESAEACINKDRKMKRELEKEYFKLFEKHP